MEGTSACIFITPCRLEKMKPGPCLNRSASIRFIEGSLRMMLEQGTSPMLAASCNLQQPEEQRDSCNALVLRTGRILVFLVAGTYCSVQRPCPNDTHCSHSGQSLRSCFTESPRTQSWFWSLPQSLWPGLTLIRDRESALLIASDAENDRNTFGNVSVC